MGKVIIHTHDAPKMVTGWYVMENGNLFDGPEYTEQAGKAKLRQMQQKYPNKKLTLGTKQVTAQGSYSAMVTHKGNPMFLDAAPCACKNKAKDATFNAKAEYRGILSDASAMVRACKNVYLLTQQAGDQAAAADARKVWDAAEKMHSLIHQNA